MRPRLLPWLAASVAAAVVAATCSGRSPGTLQQVRALGVLRVATYNDATTFYLAPWGEAGPEYELVRRLADRLGVRLELVVPPRFSAIIPLVERGRVHLAAAGLTVTAERAQRVRFGPSYQVITQQLVYRRGSPRPRDVAALAGARIEVLAGSSYAERLRELKRAHPELTWVERDDLSLEQILERVWEGLIDYTVVDSHVLAMNRDLYPGLRAAFDVSAPQALAWAFRRDDDGALMAEATALLNELAASGELARIMDRYYAHTERYDFVDARTFRRHVERRLPALEPLFRAAAERHGLDWRLLAAMAYQESHWNPQARSPTGVRGLMMLTRATARRVGVRDRLDPGQSIEGGARYLADLLSRIPQRIPVPDRYWLALAAYNIGLGHLEDARILTQRQGGDPDRWADVRERLPLLSQARWARQTRHGYARGAGAVRYVENIRRYYRVLQRLARSAPPPTPTEAPDVPTTALRPTIL